MPSLSEIKTDIDNSYPSGVQNRASGIRGLLKRMMDTARGWLDDEVLDLADQEGGFPQIYDGKLDMSLIFNGALTEDRVVVVSSGQPASSSVSISGNILDVPDTIRIDGTQVIRARMTGWGAPTGTVSRAAFDADNSPVLGGAYNQTEVEAVRDDVVEIRRFVAALAEDLRVHGLIGA